MARSKPLIMNKQIEHDLASTRSEASVTT